MGPTCGAAISYGRPPGRPPKPTALKILEGNRGKRPLDPSAEPQPAASGIKPPVWLGRTGKTFFRVTSARLSDLGLFTVLDESKLAAASERWSVYRRAAAALAKDLTQTTDKGTVLARPEANIAKVALEQCLSILTEFGMSPSARVRLKAEPPPEGADKWAGLL